MQGAVDEAYKARFLGKGIMGTGFDIDVVVHPGAGAYICGEETALLESLEGKKGFPRLKPPFPAVVGLFGCPTVINNVETIACVPPIINKGAEWYAKLGCEKNGGNRFILCQRPCESSRAFMNFPTEQPCVKSFMTMPAGSLTAASLKQ